MLGESEMRIECVDCKKVHKDDEMVMINETAETFRVWICEKCYLNRKWEEKYGD